MAIVNTVRVIRRPAATCIVTQEAFSVATMSSGSPRWQIGRERLSKAPTSDQDLSMRPQPQVYRKRDDECSFTIYHLNNQRRPRDLSLIATVCRISNQKSPFGK